MSWNEGYQGHNKGRKGEPMSWSDWNRTNGHNYDNNWRGNWSSPSYWMY
jgi:hypothetical protein